MGNNLVKWSESCLGAYYLDLDGMWFILLRYFDKISISLFQERLSSILIPRYVKVFQELNYIWLV